MTFARVGVTDPASLDDYVAHGGYRGLAALDMSGAEIVEAVTESGLRGRGGAAFPTGIKWKTVLGTAGGQKYVVCNADEGDSGTFSDRMIMEGDPFLLIEGMTIAGIAAGADRGYIDLRWEYPDAHRAFEAPSRLRVGRLGDERRGLRPALRSGGPDRRGGVYLRGGNLTPRVARGQARQVRPKPPLPAIQGLFGKPTTSTTKSPSAPCRSAGPGCGVLSNFGMGRSRGTLPIQLAGNVEQAV